MRAVIAKSFGGPDVLRVEEREAPRPGPGQVGIDVRYAGVNFAEVMGRLGRVPALEAPFVPGLEVSGFVRELGEGVEGLALGDPVCALTMIGGYAEVALASASSTYRLSSADEETMKRGAALPTIVPTAWALVNRVANVRPGENVLVSAAAGGVGSLLGQLLRRSGAGTVLGIASTGRKRDYAMGFGYDELVDEEGLADLVERRTGGRGVDVVFDSIGGDFRDRGFDLLAPMGRLVFFGNAGGAPQRLPDPERLRTECKSAVGFSVTGLTKLDPLAARSYADEAIALAAEDNLRIDITEVFPMADVGSAHRQLEGRRSIGKMLIAVGGAGA